MKAHRLTFGHHNVVMQAPNIPDRITDKWRIGSFYETGKIGMLSRCAKLCDKYTGMFALDIGAHMGNHAAFLTKIVGMKVVAFEPNPDRFNVLAANANINKFTAMNMGMADSSFQRWDLVKGPEGNTGMSELVPSEKGQVITTNVDNFMTTPEMLTQSVSLIKIDVEGMELRVLKGARKTIRAHMPDLWIETDDPQECQRAILEYSKVHYKIEGPYNATPTYRYHI